MPLNLPKLIDLYFTADRNDSNAVAKCFTENAVVKDEGHKHKGIEAINQWRTAASEKNKFTSEPFACEQKGGKTVVTGRVTGNFPGSPIDLRYFFGLEGNKIASLEISV